MSEPLKDGLGNQARTPIYLKRQREVAAFFGVGPQTVTGWKTRGGLHGDKGKGHDLFEYVNYLIDSRVDQAVNPGSTKATTKSGGGSGSSDTDELKALLQKQKFRDGELDYAERVNEVVPWVHVEHFLERMSSHMRTAGELLRKHHGEEAQKIILDALDAVEKDLANSFNAD